MSITYFEGFNLMFYMGLLVLVFMIKFPPGIKPGVAWNEPIGREWRGFMVVVILACIGVYMLGVGIAVSISSLFAVLSLNLSV